MTFDEWKPLAEQGMPEAQYNLGLMYSRGDGAPQDDKEAVKWYRAAADQGFAESQTNLGLMYGKGQGVAQDYAEAMSWYLKAAEKGHATAQLNIGTMYADGIEVPEDSVAAHMWFNIATARDIRAGAHRDMAEENLTSDEILKAQHLAREWFEKHGVMAARK